MRTVLRFIPAAAVMGVIFALSSQGKLPEPLGPDRTALAGHFLVYAILAVLLWWGLRTSRTDGGVALNLGLHRCHGLRPK